MRNVSRVSERILTTLLANDFKVIVLISTNSVIVLIIPVISVIPCRKIGGDLLIFGSSATAFPESFYISLVDEVESITFSSLYAGD